MTLNLDAFEHRQAYLGRLDPRWKLCALAAAILSVALLRTAPPIALALVGTTGLVAVAGLPWRFLAPRLGGFLIFLLPFIAVLVILRGTEGLLPAFAVAGRAATIFLMCMVLLGTATVAENVHAAQFLGVPSVVSGLALLSYRYIFVLAEEFARLRIALRVRGFRNRASLRSYRTVGVVAGTLLIRGAERADRVAHSMRCRGFDGRIHSLKTFRTRMRDLYFFSGIVAVATSLVAWDLWLRS